MDPRQIMEIIGEILDYSKAAVLSFDGGDGAPVLRWMTPAVLKDCPCSLFTVTSPKSPKIEKLRKNPRVEWMIQDPSLSEIINIKGAVRILDNPSVRCRVMEILAGRLTVFWKVNPESTDFVVLETVVEQADFFRPMKGTREIVLFKGEDE